MDTLLANVSNLGDGAKKVDQIPEGMEELLEGTEPVDWYDLCDFFHPYLCRSPGRNMSREKPVIETNLSIQLRTERETLT